MTMLGAIQWVQDEMLEITGIKSAPDYPQSGIMPIVITHLDSGTITPGDPLGQTKEISVIIVELHISESGGLLEAFTTLETLHPLIKDKLKVDWTLGGNIDTYLNITYSTVRDTFDGVPTLTRQYLINDCKLIS